MAFRKSCPRTLDRPITFFGLEAEDLLLVLAVSGTLLFFADPAAGVAAGLALWLGLTRLKRGKPPGHLTALLYRSRLFRRLPSPPHLIRPDWDRNGRMHFSAVAAESDRASPFAKGFRRGR